MSTRISKIFSDERGIPHVHIQEIIAEFINKHPLFMDVNYYNVLVPFEEYNNMLCPITVCELNEEQEEFILKHIDSKIKHKKRLR